MHDQATELLLEQLRLTAEKDHARHIAELLKSTNIIEVDNNDE